MTSPRSDNWQQKNPAMAGFERCLMMSVLCYTYFLNQYVNMKPATTVRAARIVTVDD